MKKLTATVVLSAGLALTSCSTPAPVSAEPQPQIQPFAATAPSATATITAAPIAPQDAPQETAVAASGDFGDPATDAAFLNGVSESWEGVLPDEPELIGAAKLACEKFQAGIPYREMGLVEGSSMEDQMNSIRIAVYASRNYCTDYNTDTH